MKQFTTKTGIGYITDSLGNIKYKYNLMPGTHNIKNDYTATDVVSCAELKNIVTHTPPPEIKPKSDLEVRIESLEQKIGIVK